MSDQTPRLIAEQADEFLKSEFGVFFMKQLSLCYNDLHHAAENDALTVEQKAMKVERAAGVKWAIDFLTQRQRMLAELQKKGKATK